jgi:SAM-dependent methyltransferase
MSTDSNQAHDDWRKRLRWYRSKLLRRIGYREDHWVRVAQIDSWRGFLRSLPTSTLDVCEISPAGVSYWRDFGFRSYTAVGFPEFDITRQALPRTFDIIIAEHVFEHLRDPAAAARNVRAMLKDGGIFLMATPFLIRVHGSPFDYSRWTPDGLKIFLETNGFTADIRAWGNGAAVKANLRRWKEYGWHKDLTNDPLLPVTVWAFARAAALPS